MSLFAIDYDGTWSADPELFETFVALLRTRGHDAILVTGRSDSGRWGAEVRAAVRSVPIVFAANKWKREAAKAAGYKVDIWIDDFPEYIDKQDPDKAKPREAAT